MTNTVIALAATCASLALAASSATAQGADAPLVAGVFAVDDAIDWTGAYAGISAGGATTDFTPSSNIFGGIAISAGDEGGVYGLHAGYLASRGDLVFGPELSISGSDAELVGGPGAPEIDFAVRLGLRGGYAVDRFLGYGLLGATYVEGGEGSTGFDETGYLAGLGLEYRLTDRASVGAQYTVSGFDAGVSGLEADAKLRTLELRANLHF